MMIASTCLLVTLTILIHGQVSNSHVVTARQATDSLKSDTPRISVGEMNDRMEFDEGSGIMETMINVEECLGTGFPFFPISLQNPSGCFIFQTTGFNMGGYPNYSGSAFPSYVCSYFIQFGATVSGTVTVKENDFQFQEPDSNGECLDFVVIFGVNDAQQQNDNSDPEDRNSRTDAIEYCGTITGDKIRAFSGDELFIRLAADRSVNGNGAEMVICIN
ncbi:uncharacterized protein LOC131891381 [Tigriopus californicus]|uniref:uncharacterized protein LOC131891381 n=1 Tax=Tigriopus californicus TaxID=6832 RepID=UPI0027DA5719|nr:uncharacterized protein LOC131891381 [Tigriopus californicus]